MSRHLILAAEDEPGIRNLLTLGLPGFGMDVLAVSRGAEALALYRDRGPDIAAVVLDEVLPDMRGLDVFAELRQLNPDVRACFITGWGSSFPDDTSSQFPVLRKPFALADLAQTLRELIG